MWNKTTFLGASPLLLPVPILKTPSYIFELAKMRKFVLLVVRLLVGLGWARLVYLASMDGKPVDPTRPFVPIHAQSKKLHN
jgi:hypothetical protein